MTPASSRPGPLSAVREFSGCSVQVPHTFRQGPAGALGCWLPWRACRGRGGGEGGPRPSPRVCGQLPVAAGAHSSGVERGPQILQGCEWGRGSPQWPLMETIGTAHTQCNGQPGGAGRGAGALGTQLCSPPCPHEATRALGAHACGLKPQFSFLQARPSPSAPSPRRGAEEEAERRGGRKGHQPQLRRKPAPPGPPPAAPEPGGAAGAGGSHRVHCLFIPRR